MKTPKKIVLKMLKHKNSKGDINPPPLLLNIFRKKR